MNVFADELDVSAYEVQLNKESKIVYANGNVQITDDKKNIIFTEKAEYNKDNIFNLNVPISIDGIDSNVLDPKCSWDSPQEYDRQATHLAKLFIKNFKKYGEKVGHLEQYGPMLVEI